jgi:hypothetical protein
LGTDQRRQGFAEVSRADAFEIQPRNQLLKALRLPQVRRQNLRSERLRCSGGSSIQDAGLPDLDGTDAGQERPLRQMAIANDLVMASAILDVPARI